MKVLESTFQIAVAVGLVLAGCGSGPVQRGLTSGEAGACGDATDDAACDAASQDGCPTGDKCSISDLGAASCQPDGVIETGARCGASGVDDCIHGDSCLGPNTQTTCRRSCATGSDCGRAAVPAGATAEPRNVPHCESAEFYGNGTKMCSVACNPVSAAGASGCAEGLGCAYLTYSNSNGLDYTDCTTPGEAAEGMPCGSPFYCQEGLSCVAADTSSLCRAVCRPGKSGDCAAGDACVVGGNGTAKPMFGFCCPAEGCNSVHAP